MKVIHLKLCVIKIACRKSREICQDMTQLQLTEYIDQGRRLVGSSIVLLILPYW